MIMKNYIQIKVPSGPNNRMILLWNCWILVFFLMEWEKESKTTLMKCVFLSSSLVSWR